MPSKLTLWAATLLASSAFAQTASQASDGQVTAASAATQSVGVQSDGQPTVQPTSTASSVASSAPVSGTETALFSSLAITEASHTETIQVPVNTETGPVTFVMSVETEAGATETISVATPVSPLSTPVGPTAQPVTTPVAPTDTATGPYVPTSGFTSTVITEADHTETVPIPIVSYATQGGSFSSLAITEASHTETVPVPVNTAATSAAASATGASNGTYTQSAAPQEYTGAAVAQKPIAALLAGAMAAAAFV